MLYAMEMKYEKMLLMYGYIAIPTTVQVAYHVLDRFET